ncbi:hypothetical protein BRC71_06275 [Halobacteriales archaeon QH_7_65_31]|nr:MAG: hypothetical protein BRC71_06275 [Halobacteriales archaeon QH_7_65_31]
MARGDARKRAGETGRNEDSSRTYCGRYTVSGDDSNGYRVVLPKSPAQGEGIEPGDEIDVEHDPDTGRFVYEKVNR